MDTDFSNARDRHLFGPGPKRILALGGSAYGAMSTIILSVFLERIEAILGEKSREDTRLSDHFDLVGGASLGAVAATAVALGNRAAEIKNFLLSLDQLFSKRISFQVPILQPKFDARAMRKLLEELVGDRLVSSVDLVTGLTIVMKRMDTGS